jgi:hypothetical protein
MKKGRTGWAEIIPRDDKTNFVQKTVYGTGTPSKCAMYGGRLECRLDLNILDLCSSSKPRPGAFCQAPLILISQCTKFGISDQKAIEQTSEGVNMIVKIGESRVSISVEGCFRCGTSFRSRWYPFKEISVRFGEKSVRQIMLHVCNDCAMADEKIAVLRNDSGGYEMLKETYKAKREELRAKNPGAEFIEVTRSRVICSVLHGRC